MRSPTEGAEAGAALRERVRSLQLPDTVAPGSSFLRAVPWLLCLLLLAGNFALGSLYLFGKKPAESAPQNGTTQKATPASGTRAAADKPAEGSLALENKGYIIPAHQILVSPKVSGMVLELNIEEGKRLNKGDVIAVLEDTEYQAEANRAKAALEMAEHRLAELKDSWPKEIGQAKAELAEAGENLIDLERIYERNKDLSKGNLITKQELEQSESQFKAQKQKIQRLKLSLELLETGPRERRIKAAQSDVDQATAELRKATWRLENCTIRAPISGTVLKKNAEQGNIVNPIAFNGSFSLCDMADLSDLEVELSVQERDISKVFVGQHCRVKADAFPDREYDGVVSRQMPIADRAKGSISVRVKVKVPADEEGVYLKPEMVVTVWFYTGKTVAKNGSDATRSKPGT